MSNQFEGMSDEPFSYEDFKTARNLLIQTIHKNLNDSDKKFLLSFENGSPDWSFYNFEGYPAVQWKLQNVQKLKKTNTNKHREQLNKLKNNFQGNQ